MRSTKEIYYQAFLARDPRFDGKFFIGVKTTGIYCRPTCLTAEVLANEALTELGTTRIRKATIQEFSRRVLEGKLKLSSTQDPAEFQQALRSIKGIGPWTAECIRLRALGDPDAFPGTDLILKRALEKHPELDLEKFKPWQAYAASYLWKEYA